MTLLTHNELPSKPTAIRPKPVSTKYGNVMSLLNLNHSSHLVSLTLLLAVVATSSSSKEDGVNLPIRVEILLSDMLAYFNSPYC